MQLRIAGVIRIGSKTIWKTCSELLMKFRVSMAILVSAEIKTWYVFRGDLARTAFA